MSYESFSSTSDSRVILKSKAVAVEVHAPPNIVPEAVIAKSIEEYSFSWLKPVVSSICSDYDTLKAEKNILTEALATLTPPFNDFKGIEFPKNLSEEINLDQISSREFNELNNTAYESFKTETVIRFAQFKKFCIETRIKIIDKTINDLLSEASIAYKVENKYFETFDDIKQSSISNRRLTAISRGISWIQYSSEIRNIRTRSGYIIIDIIINIIVNTIFINDIIIIFKQQR